MRAFLDPHSHSVAPRRPLLVGLRRGLFAFVLLAVCIAAAFAQPFPGFFQARSLGLGDGRLLVGGTVAHAADPTFYDFAVGRLLANGAPDPSFNGTGLALLPIWGDYEFATALAVQGDGRIVVAGLAGDPARPLSCDFLDCDAYVAVVRLNGDGSIDPTFNSGARLILQIGDVGPEINQSVPDRTLDSIAFQGDGKILLLGSASAGSPGLARINANGTLDSSYAPPKYAVRTVDWMPVIEYYNATLNHYFVTADRFESSLLDHGVFVGWKRTRQAFRATLTGRPNAIGAPVCRLYGNPAWGLDTHFYTANLQECQDLANSSGGAWILEGTDVFRILEPDKVTGICPAGMAPIYRLFNNRHDVNHRFTTSIAIRDQMVAQGFVREGYGPVDNPVSMCAAP
jgi:uncharacterized delta-60 repeat protein